MFCSKCGKEVAADAKFCPYCGCALGAQFAGSDAEFSEQSSSSGQSSDAASAGAQGKGAASQFAELQKKLDAAGARTQPYTFTWALYRVYKERYLDFSSRACRSEYWWATLGYVIVSLAVGILSFMFGMFGTFGNLLGALIEIVIAVALLIPGIAVSARRLHDRNLSGWWLLLGLIPIVNVIAGIALLIIFCLPGTPGNNRFGPDPLAQN